jgi:hypothetical protein
MLCLVFLFASIVLILEVEEVKILTAGVWRRVLYALTQ